MVDHDIRERWAGEISERTALTADELLEGAVDVEWFHRAYDMVGEARWSAVYDAAKYASTGSGHIRARTFADALQGRVGIDQLAERVASSRNPDAVRAIGLVPLAGPQDALQRYELIRRFGAGSKAFGAQRRETEATAVRIALHNLARTAGFQDPLRLTWAMEAAAIADLAAGPVTASTGLVAVTLSIGNDGAPVLSVTKNGAVLKKMPPAARKDPEVAALVERHRDLDAQVRRIASVLESMMVGGAAISTEELVRLLDHPMVGPMLRRLVVVDATGAWSGRPDRAGGRFGGLVLRSADASAVVPSPDATFRIAHPIDLSADSRGWADWQLALVRDEVRQPFKQVFRELHLPTEDERRSWRCTRFEGHQVNPGQAAALLAGRGWVPRDGEGFSRTFHDAGVTAWLDSDVAAIVQQPSRPRRCRPFASRGATPHSGWPTCRRVSSARPSGTSTWSCRSPHVGGVDPGASHSTVEMRACAAHDDLRTAAAHQRRGARRPRHGGGCARSVLGSPGERLGGSTARWVRVHRAGARPASRADLPPLRGRRPAHCRSGRQGGVLARDREIKDPTILVQLRG